MGCLSRFSASLANDIMASLTLLEGKVNGPHLICSRIALELISGASFFSRRTLTGGPVADDVK
jgi:hypothetical protein